MKYKTKRALNERRLSVLDLIYVIRGSRKTEKEQIICQLVIEGEGDISDNSLRKAISLTSAVVPASRFVLRGFWGFKHWSADGPLPTLSTYRMDWEGTHGEKLLQLEEQFDLHVGPVMNIIKICSREKIFIVFRVHHSVMDGIGLMEYAKQFFKVLRDEVADQVVSHKTIEDIQFTPEKIAKSRFLDKENTNAKTKIIESIINRYKKTKKEPIALPFTIHSENKINMNNNRIDIGEKGTLHSRIWSRIQLDYSDIQLLPKVIESLVALVAEHSTASTRIVVPVDLRRYLPDDKIVANFAGGVVLELSERDTIRSIVRLFNQELSAGKDIPPDVAKWSMIGRWLPLPLLAIPAQHVRLRRRKRSKFSATATLSHFGLVDLEEFNAESFQCHSVFAIPIHSVTPLFITLCCSKSKSEIVFGANSSLVGIEELDSFANKMMNSLTKGIDDRKPCELAKVG